MADVDHHGLHLQFIAKLPAPALTQFCGIAVDFISNGPNRGKFAKAAASLGVTEEEVTEGVDALAHLFVDAAKASMGPIGFARMIPPEFSEEATKVLFQVHIDKQAAIRQVLKDMELGQHHYVNMHWRLDIQVGSKSVRNTVDPSFVMRIDTEDGHEKNSFHLEADFANLERMHQELETALKATTTPHFNTVSRAVTRSVGKAAPVPSVGSLPSK